MAHVLHMCSSTGVYCRCIGVEVERVASIGGEGCRMLVPGLMPRKLGEGQGNRGAGLIWMSPGDPGMPLMTGAGHVMRTAEDTGMTGRQNLFQSHR